MIINGDYFCPHTFPGRISPGRRRRVPRAPVPSCSQPRGRGGRRWGGKRGAPERIAASSAPRGPVGRGGAGDSRERRGRAGCGAARPQPRHPPRHRSRRHAGLPLCSPLSPAFLSLTHPRRRRISSLGRGMPARRTGLGPSNGSCSTAPRLHRRETAGPPQAGRGAMAAVPAGGRGGDGERVNSEPQPSSAGGSGRCHPRGQDGLAVRRGTGARHRLAPRHSPGRFLASPVCSGAEPGG